MPECEIKDSADDKTVEIQAKPGVTTTTPLPVKLIAHKDDTKPKWLREIRDHINDPLTLQEHQADDLRIDPTHVLEIDEPIFRLPHKVDAHESDSGIRPSDIAKDYFVTKHKVEEKSVKSEQQVVSSSVEAKVEQTVVQRSTVESRTSITGAVEQTTLSAQSVQISKVKDTNQEQIQKVETKAKEEIVVKPEETPKVSRSSAVELTEERKVSQSNVAQSIQSEQQISQSKAVSEKRIEEKTTQVKTEQPALLKADQKQSELQTVQKKEPAPEASVQKSEAEKEPVVTKQPEVKAIEVAKQPPAKEPEVTKKPEVKESEVTKQPEVKEPEVIKQPEVRKPEVIKQPEVKEPALTKQPEIKKPEVKKEEHTPPIPTTEKPKLEEVPLLPDTKQKEQEPTTEAVLTPIHKEEQLLKSIDTGKLSDLREMRPRTPEIVITDIEELLAIRAKELLHPNRLPYDADNTNTNNQQSNTQGQAQPPQITIRITDEASLSQWNNLVDAIRSGGMDGFGPPPPPLPPHKIPMPGFFTPLPRIAYEISLEVLVVRIPPPPPPPPPPPMVKKVLVHTESLERKTQAFLEGYFDSRGLDTSLRTAKQKIRSIKTTVLKSDDTIKYAEDTVHKAKARDFLHIFTPPIRPKRPVYELIDVPAGPGDIEECSESVAGDYRELSSEVESRAPSVARMDDYNYSSRYSSRSSRKRYESEY